LRLIKQPDNTASFQKVIDAASDSGRIVTVHDGKFLIKGSLLLNGISLKGESILYQFERHLNGIIILAKGVRDNEKFWHFSKCVVRCWQKLYCGRIRSIAGLADCRRFEYGKHIIYCYAVLLIHEM
jgi:hypothetical protein